MEGKASSPSLKLAENVNDITEDHQGRIWVAVSRTQLHTPLCMVFPGNARCFGAVNGIPFAYGGTVTVDAEGNLVASSASEVIRGITERGLMSSYTFEDMKQNEALHGIATFLQDSNGTSLIGIGFAGKGMGLQQTRAGSASTLRPPVSMAAALIRRACSGTGRGSFRSAPLPRACTLQTPLRNISLRWTDYPAIPFGTSWRTGKEIFG